MTPPTRILMSLAPSGGLAWAVAAMAIPPLLGACSGDSEAASPPPVESAEALPDPADAGLVTPEEAAQAAQKGIDASNAENELERLQREIDQR